MSTSEPNAMRVLTQRSLQDKVVVFYREALPPIDDQAPAEGFGYTVTARQGAGWSSRGGGATTGEPIAPDGLTEYGVFDVFSDPDELYAVVMGETKDLSVAVAEVQFTNNDVARENVADGAFIVIAPQADVAACELRLLAQDATLIQTLPLPNCD